MRNALRAAIVLAAATCAGCSLGQGFSLKPYRLNIQQGNYLEAEDVAQLEVGMTSSQVRFLLGTPMIADPFNPNRWDYVFYFRVGRTGDETVSNLTVWFENDKVVRIDRPDSDDPMGELDAA
ncbi:MAG: outer membrane protein assembly factor BamE [Gammaproteobacteria bacterium]